MKLPFNKTKTKSEEITVVPAAQPVAPDSPTFVIPKPAKPAITKPTDTIGLGIDDVLAPGKIELNFDSIQIGSVFYRTLFVAGYPRFVVPGWLEPLINFDHSLDISFFVYPTEARTVLDELRRKITEMEAEMSTDIQRGKIVNPSTEAKLEDAKALQEQLVKGIERFYQFSFYITIPAATEEELNSITRRVESTLASILINAKHATFDMRKGFLSSAPYGKDVLTITRNMDTTSLATTFPFTTAELSSDTGILYGINSQNDSFIIFDRFSLENSNLTVFATSGAGKSLAYNDSVLVRHSKGDVALEKIGDVVEKTFKKGNIEQLERDIQGVLTPNIEVYSFDKNLQGGWSPVQIAAKKVSPKTLYKITTKSGREVTVTKDHCLIVLKDGKVQAIKGMNAQISDFIPLPRQVFQNQNQKTVLDVSKLLRKKDWIKIKDGRIGHKKTINHTSLPATIQFGEKFAEILGYFVSEGNVLPTVATICNEDVFVLSKIKEYYNELGLRYNESLKNGRISSIRVASKVYIELLRSLGLSGKSHEKRVPPAIFNLANKEVAAFLSAYFEGDGGVEEHEISATTKSKRLASDLSYLLLRFGIIARVHKTIKFATNTKLQKRRTYWRIRISGQQNIENFIDKIGFITKRKTGLAKKLLRNGNTNVDTIPEIENIFKEIYQVLYNSEIPAPKHFSEIKLGIFKPSPKELLKVIAGLEQRISEIEALDSDGLSTLRSLPTLEEILEKGGQKDMNTQLWNSIGKSWHTTKKGIPPQLANTLKAVAITHGYEYTTEYIGGAIYRSFKNTGESLHGFDKQLWERIKLFNSNADYERILNARNYISERYETKKKDLKRVKERISWLKTLAKADLFWDEIVKIEKVRAKHPFVYDLQVENQVFLAGHAGMFIHNSFFVKLESLRSLMMGAEVIVIDPENEYKSLAEAVGGEYISFSFSSPSKINPFDLSQIYEKGENQLGLKILTLHSLFKVIMGQISPSQEALLDRALIEAYRAKGITQDPDTQHLEPPLIEDLYKSLIGMEVPDALDLAARIEKYVKGSYVGIFDQQTNIDIKNPFTVFSVRDIQDTLRPIAMFVILDFIWTKVRTDVKKRILVVDEAWHMMRYQDTAQFLWSIVKRARKYYLGLTTITQDVEDFLSQDIGKAVVTNSAMRLLLKQSPAAIDRIAETFYLSQGEKQLLLAANVGEGILFAGPHHAPIRVVASNEEYQFVTTRPSDVVGKPGTSTVNTQSTPVAETVALTQPEIPTS